MYPFAHLGLALLAARALRGAKGFAELRWRWLALGALLPDLLDKPLGLVVLDLHEGRLIGHTLVFAGALLAAGLARTGPLSPVALIGWGCLSHLALDLPAAPVLLWPAFGWQFPIRGYTLTDVATDLWSRPDLLAGEVAGVAALAFVAWERRRRAVG